MWKVHCLGLSNRLILLYYENASWECYWAEAVWCEWMKNCSIINGKLFVYTSGEFWRKNEMFFYRMFPRMIILLFIFHSSMVLVLVLHFHHQQHHLIFWSLQCWLCILFPHPSNSMRLLHIRMFFHYVFMFLILEYVGLTCGKNFIHSKDYENKWYSKFGNGVAHVETVGGIKLPEILIHNEMWLMGMNVWVV